ncbi:phage late control protein [Psychrobacter glaciei]|uniref:Phage late control protein n=1 Tax=Psychrobacter glaciei TaxID=619771 RepID=A0ABQ3GN09_9GAMM|nr:contractile injection system protein, VgrG/Pvc8 family [Psychrobacter glaciei]GHD25999.1 phage late control protein [Psychrobacter glaciei]
MALFKLTIEGIDRTMQVEQRLISLSMTDKRGTEADELSITLSDHDAALPFPTKGNEIRLWLAMPDTGDMIDKGTFTIDQPEHSGTPDQLQIRAKSADFKSSLKVKRSDSYHQHKLGEIAQTVAKRHDLVLAIDAAVAAMMIDHIDQHRESDINLLTRLCDDHDLMCTIKAGRLIIKPIGNSQAPSGVALGQVNITRQSGDSHRYSRADRTSDYDETTASYHDESSGKTKHISVKDGKSKPLDSLPNDKAHVLTKPAKSKKEAVTKAKASDNKKARQVASFDLTLAVARPDIIADSPATVRGFRPYIDDHQWIVIEVTHDLSGSGYSTGIKCEAGI